MPQLPDWTSLGSAPSGNSGRPISSTKDFSEEVSRTMLGNASAAGQSGKGLEALGAGAAKIGEAGMTLAREQHYEQMKLATAHADAALTVDRVNGIKQFTEDPDYDTAPERFKNSIPDRVKTIAEQYITDPSARELWTLKAQDELARDWTTVDAKSRAKREAYLGVVADDSLAALGQTYVEAEKYPDAGHMREEAVKAANAVIDERVAKGAWTEEQAMSRRKQFATGTFSASLANKDFPTQMAALKGFEYALVQQESNGNPTSQNKWGYSGLYQFGAPRLETLGVYKPGTNENLKTWSNEASTLANTPSKWTGYFDIPGFPNVKTVKDFMASPEAQKKVFQMHIAEIDNEIVKRGLDKFVGQTVQGVRITKEGIEAMAHLGGMDGADAVLHGRPWKGDANGSTLMQYAKLGLGGTSGDPMADAIDPAHREQLVNSFIDQNTRLKRQEEIQTKEQVAATAGSFMDRALHGDYGTPTKSILDDIKDNPVLANDPELKWRLTKTIENDQQSAAKGEAKTLGVGINEARNKVLDGSLRDYKDVLALSALEDGDPNKLSLTGVDAVHRMIDNITKNPVAHSTEQVKQSMIEYAKGKLVVDNPLFAADKDEKGRDIFTAQFMPMFLNGFEDWVKDGKNPRDYLDKANVDKMIAGLRDPNELAQRRLIIGAMPTGAAGAPNIQRPPNVPEKNWEAVTSAPPLDKFGKPFRKDIWAQAVSVLAKSPTRPTIDIFNATPVGKQISGEKVLESLGIPVSQEAGQPAPAAPPAPATSAPPNEGADLGDGAGWAAPEEIKRQKAKKEEAQRIAREEKAKRDKLPPWQTSGLRPWEVR